MFGFIHNVRKMVQAGVTAARAIPADQRLLMLGRAGLTAAGAASSYVVTNRLTTQADRIVEHTEELRTHMDTTREIISNPDTAVAVAHHISNSPRAMAELARARQAASHAYGIRPEMGLFKEPSAAAISRTTVGAAQEVVNTSASVAGAAGPATGNPADFTAGGGFTLSSPEDYFGENLTWTAVGIIFLTIFILFYFIVNTAVWVVANKLIAGNSTEHLIKVRDDSLSAMKDGLVILLCSAFITSGCTVL